MIYEWDENKRLKNVEKHGYDLADGQLVYESPTKITVVSHRPNEHRWLDIAEVGGEVVVLSLTYTLRRDAVRCISLRKASPRKGASIMAKITRRNSDEIKELRSKGEIMTDKERVSNFSEAEVEQMALDDPDNFLKTDQDWAQATIHRPGTRGPQKAPTKKSIAIRLSQDVVDNFKSTGAGWQSRIDEALKTYLKEHPLKHA